MRRAATVLMVTTLAALGLGSCADGGGSSGSGEQRTVLVDFRHDEFASAFLGYYPSNLQIRPGDTIDFRQAWTGEPHSVTFGSVVDGFMEQIDAFMEYDSVEDALAGGESQEDVDRFLEVYERLPTMTTEDFEILPYGAEPCYIEALEDAPRVRDGETDELLPDVECPEGGTEQPAFNGRHAIYNSGFIPYDGPSGNRFSMPIAEDAEPGTYQYFCNYHFPMVGSIEVVKPDADIPSQSEVSKQARLEIEEGAQPAIERVEEAKGLEVGDTVGDDDELTLPLAGRETAEESLVIINEFLPSKIETVVGREVTWTIDGFLHTVSFNVPKYFPIFTVADDGAVTWDPQAYEAVGFEVERPVPPVEAGPPPPVAVDAGPWDGSGGFHSSGVLVPGDSFSVTFTKAGTYAYACVLHPQMVGTVEVGR